MGCTLFADDAAGICPSLEAAKQFYQHVTNWVTTNEMSVGIAKCGLMEFLPHDTAIAPLVPGHAVDGLTLEGLPLPIVDRYMYLGILMTPGLTIESMVDHRIWQGRATVASVIPYLPCPVLPMSMRLVTVAVMVGPRLLFGAELYGMNRSLTDKMQVLMNRALRACIGASRVGNVPSVGLWKEVRTLPICALAGARRARAYAKALDLKTWLRNMVLQPFRSRSWTWCSGAQDQAGLALILRCRIGAFVTIPTLVKWKNCLRGIGIGVPL